MRKYQYTSYLLTILIALTFSLIIGGTSYSRSPANKPVMHLSVVRSDEAILSELNARFIRNFIAQDTLAHNEIIHPNFVCIESTGEIVNRSEYMVRWATDFSKGHFTSFRITDEAIRIFGNMALVRSKTIYKRTVNDREVHGNSIYTDTYIKEDGRWWCVQAQITPVIQ